MSLCKWIGLAAAMTVPWLLLAGLIMLGWSLSMVPREIYELGRAIISVVIIGLLLAISGIWTYSTVIEWCRSKKGASR